MMEDPFCYKSAQAAVLCVVLDTAIATTMQRMLHGEILKADAMAYKALQSLGAGPRQHQQRL